MASYRYLIVGGGMTADSACRGIRDHDRDGTIGLFGAESHEPYVRPPLTKGLWTGKDESSIFRGTPELDVDVHAGRRIVSLDLDARTATDDTGESHAYEKLLLATGGTPRQLPGAANDVIYYRTLDDYHRLRALAGDGVRVVVVGGGFIGSEIAAALATNGCDVTIVFPGPGIGARIFSDLFDLGYEAVGDVDSELDTVAHWAEPNRKGVVAYVDAEGKARGFLLWDVWDKVDAARELIRAGTVVDVSHLRRLLD